ncbi:type II secretion system protein [Candidatus Saccharibacteria bacterium]|nr:type II secretion system protein [Candidatus Saccharibacteria bacterium]
MNTRRHGFTIVEVLITIIVIGILAAIVLIGYNGMKSRSQAAAISDGLVKVERSMNAWGLNNELARWPLDPISGGGKPLQEMIDEDPSLRENLSSIPKVSGVHTDDWFYDNEGDIKTECDMHYDGVNIVVRFVRDQSVAQAVDDTLDDGDLLCGKVRYVDERIFYALSYTQQFE